MIGSKIGHSLDPAIISVYRFFFRDKIINPNIFTLCGTAAGFISAIFTAFGFLLWGGVTLAISGFLDLLDGAIARNANRATDFGGFLDSVLDRYSDLAVMSGVLAFYLRSNNMVSAFLTFVAATGIAIIPYARARAEAASISCTTGIMERSERIVLLLIGLFFNTLDYVIPVLAVLTHVTVIQRIVHVKRALLQNRRDI